MSKALENLDVWMKIESYVHSVYPNFLSNLSAKHGKLTEYEIIICMLTLLKRSPSEIAEILQMKDVHAVHSEIARLRDKFGVIEGHLIVYLLKMANDE